MQITLIIYVSMRKISLYPPGILLLFIVLFAQPTVFATTGYVAQSVNDQPTNPTRPRTTKIFSVSGTADESQKFNINNSQFVN